MVAAVLFCSAGCSMIGSGSADTSSAARPQSQPSSPTTVAEPSSPAPEVEEVPVLPPLLAPVAVNTWARPFPIEVPVVNGAIVIHHDGFWTVYDSTLDELWSEQILPSHTSGEWYQGLGLVDATSWPDVAIGFGDGEVLFVDIADRRTYALKGYHGTGEIERLPISPRVGLDGPRPDVGIAIDFKALTGLPIPQRIEQVVNPPTSPDGELLLVDGRSNLSDGWTVEVRPTADPSQVLWQYRAPEGLRFLDSGSFAPSGDMAIRAAVEGSTDVVQYHGQPGEDLQLIEAEQIWAAKHPGLPVTVDGLNAVVTTGDGIETKLGPEGAELVCGATGWNAAIGDGVVSFFGPDYETTQRASFETPRSMSIDSVGTIEWIQTASGQDGVSLHGLVDCVNRRVDLAPVVANTLELDAIYSVLNRGESNERGVGSVLVFGEPQDLVLITAPDGGVWPILRMEYIYDASVSPDGQTLAATYRQDGEDVLSLIPIDFGEIVTISLSDNRVDRVVLDRPYGVTWLLG